MMLNSILNDIKLPAFAPKRGGGGVLPSFTASASVAQVRACCVSASQPYYANQSAVLLATFVCRVARLLGGAATAVGPRTPGTLASLLACFGDLATASLATGWHAQGDGRPHTQK